VRRTLFRQAFHLEEVLALIKGAAGPLCFAATARLAMPKRAQLRAGAARQTRTGRVTVEDAIRRHLPRISAARLLMPHNNRATTTPPRGVAHRSGEKLLREPGLLIATSKHHRCVRRTDSQELGVDVIQTVRGPRLPAHIARCALAPPSRYDCFFSGGAWTVVMLVVAGIRCLSSALYRAAV